MEDNISVLNNGYTIVTLISKDNKTNNKLYLFVSFTHIKEDMYEYSYSFMLYDNDGNQLTDALTRRSEVAKYLPDEIKNNRQIFPIIEDMTRKLLENTLPNKILRKTAEMLKNDNSLKRYEVIGNILINEYGYILTNEYTGKGVNYWEYSKKDIVNNSKMEESYTLYDLPTWEDTKRAIKEQVLPEFEKYLKNNPEK